VFWLREAGLVTVGLPFLGAGFRLLRPAVPAMVSP
jgi:hypothetical protein